jgi:hypothetical protein
MTPRNLFVATVGVSLLHGLVPKSLVFWMAYSLTPLWMPDLIPLTPETWFYFASLMTATVTLLLSAVPAGLFERLTGRAQSDNASMLVWFGAAILFTLLSLLAVRG